MRIEVHFFIDGNSKSDSNVDDSFASSSSTLIYFHYLFSNILSYQKTLFSYINNTLVQTNDIRLIFLRGNQNQIKHLCYSCGIIIRSGTVHLSTKYLLMFFKHTHITNWFKMFYTFILTYFTIINNYILS